MQPRVTNESDIFLSFTVNLNLIMSHYVISCVSVSSGICSIKHKSYKKESVSYYSFFFLGGGVFLLESLTLLLIQ